MRNNSNEISTGAALLMTLGIMIFIGWIFSLTEPKCSMSGCDKDAREDSRYCYLHGWSYKSYGNPDYNAVYNESVRRRESYASESSSSESSSSKKSNPYDSYDEGYEAVYMDDDYDWDRYWSDSDYADGVDDAMEDEEW